MGGLEGMHNLQLISCKWDEMDLDEVSKFVYNNKIGIYRDADDSENVKRYLSNIQKRFPSEIVFMVRKDKELYAWAALDREGKTFAELGRWQPVVKETSLEDEIADLILKGILDYSMKNGITRIEGLFSDVKKSNEEEYMKCASWFTRNSLPKLEDNAYMTISFNETDLVPRRTLGELSVESLEGIDENTLYECYYETFVTGKDSEFLDMTDEQRRQKFDKSLQSDSTNMDLSSVLKDGNKIVGFAFIQKRENEEHVDRFGIRKEYQGKGLAKSHLLHVIHEAKETRTPLMSIGVDMSNINAFNLYKNVGFEIESRTIIHTWKSE